MKKWLICLALALLLPLSANASGTIEETLSSAEHTQLSAYMLSGNDGVRITVWEQEENGDQRMTVDLPGAIPPGAWTRYEVEHLPGVPEYLCFAASADKVEGQPMRVEITFFRNPEVTDSTFAFFSANQYTRLSNGLVELRCVIGQQLLLRQGFFDDTGWFTTLSTTRRYNLPKPMPEEMTSFTYEALGLEYDLAARTPDETELAMLGKLASGMITGERLPVYTGPGGGYWRADAGTRTFDTDQNLYVLGFETDWAMVAYEKDERFHYGYIEKSHLPVSMVVPDLWWAQSAPYVIEADEPLWDSPNPQNAEAMMVLRVEDEWTVTTLAEMEEGGRYVACHAPGFSPVRGFVGIR